MSEAKSDESELNALLCVDTIDHVDDVSDPINGMARARVYFKNGHSLSIIRGQYSYGGDEGLFEIMPSDEKFIDEEDSGDSVVGYLTTERVQYYIDKIGAIGA